MQKEKSKGNPSGVQRHCVHQAGNIRVRSLTVWVGTRGGMVFQW